MEGTSPKKEGEICNSTPQALSFQEIFKDGIKCCANLSFIYKDKYFA